MKRKESEDRQESTMKVSEKARQQTENNVREDIDSKINIQWDKRKKHTLKTMCRQRTLVRNKEERDREMGARQTKRGYIERRTERETVAR